MTKSEFGILTYLLVPLITFGLSMAVFTFIFGKFINAKIQNIYKIISSKQVVEESGKNYDLNQDVLTKLTQDTAEWAGVQQKQIAELKKQAAFRKEFLGNLAHELKTPVFSIQGYILTLLEGGLEDERVNRDFLERALSGVDRISNLLEDLDQIAMLETDRFKFKMSKFDVVDLIRSTFEELESKASEKSIELKFSKHHEPIWVKGDKNRIIQVLVNLLSNSISYGNENGRTTVSVENLDRNKVIVEVSDNGLGIEQEHIARLFERFYRVDKSRQRNSGGSGLGLAIVKHIIEAHQQTISVRSTEGLGSTFSFTLEKADSK
jgi:two-component system phosphate regulon sensor histidine kinase PhoR